jgi:hypothetical protein
MIRKEICESNATNASSAAGFVMVRDVVYPCITPKDCTYIHSVAKQQVKNSGFGEC